jgi:hypothetical protein
MSSIFVIEDRAARNTGIDVYRGSDRQFEGGLSAITASSRAEIPSRTSNDGPRRILARLQSFKKYNLIVQTSWVFRTWHHENREKD